MESLINEILRLDKKTKEFTIKSNKELEDAKSNLQKTLNEYEFENHEKAKEKANEVYDQVYNQAMDEVEDLKKKNEDRLRQVEEVYKNNKNDLVDQAIELLNL